VVSFWRNRVHGNDIGYELVTSALNGDRDLTKPCASVIADTPAH